MTFDFASIDEVRLSHGAHAAPEQGMCFMEMTAWFAGERHSDKPNCACPVLGSFGIAINDAMPDAERDRLLKPMVPLIAGTRGTIDDELCRARFLAMWVVNRIMPVWLRAYRAPALDTLAAACETARTPDDLNNLAALAALADLAALAALADLAALAALADLAARAARARDQIHEILVEGLREAILIGPHEGFPASINLEERRAGLRDLVAA